MPEEVLLRGGPFGQSSSNQFFLRPNTTGTILRIASTAISKKRRFASNRFHKPIAQVAPFAGRGKYYFHTHSARENGPTPTYELSSETASPKLGNPQQGVGP